MIIAVLHRTAESLKDSKEKKCVVYFAYSAMGLQTSLRCRPNVNICNLYANIPSAYLDINEMFLICRYTILEPYYVILNTKLKS